jgi:hypothetical protein
MQLVLVEVLLAMVEQPLSLEQLLLLEVTVEETGLTLEHLVLLLQQQDEQLMLEPTELVLVAVVELVVTVALDVLNLNTGYRR